jgi:hypothetical protein
MFTAQSDALKLRQRSDGRIRRVFFVFFRGPEIRSYVEGVGEQCAGQKQNEPRRLGAHWTATPNGQ